MPFATGKSDGANVSFVGWTSQSISVNEALESLRIGRRDEAHERVGRSADSGAVRHAAGDRLACRTSKVGSQQGIESTCQLRTGQGSHRECFADVEFADPFRIIELVMGPGNNDLRNPRMHGLRCGTDPSMMDKCSRMLQ